MLTQGNSQPHLHSLLLIGEGFVPSESQMTTILDGWKEQFPRFLMGRCHITRLQAPPVKNGAAKLAAAIIASGNAKYLSNVAMDLEEGCGIFLTTIDFPDSSSVHVWATFSSPSPLEENSQETALRQVLKPLLSLTRKDEAFGPSAASGPNIPKKTVQWAHTRIESLGCPSNLNLRQLSRPLFEALPETSDIPTICEEVKIQRLTATATGRRRKEDYEALEEATSQLPERYPHFALGYLWYSIALVGLDRSAEALTLLERAFDLCPNVSPLCQGLAMLYEALGKIEQLGWLMQDSFLGSNSYYTYLRLSHAATHCGMSDLAAILRRESNRLLQSDRGWDLAPDEDTILEQLVATYLSETTEAFKIFRGNLISIGPDLVRNTED